MRTLIALVICVSAGLGPARSVPVVQQDTADRPLGASSAVAVLTLDDDPITPVTARYLARGLEEAAAMNASAVVIRLDTPGGLMQSTQTIVRDILASSVPVIVYVAPSGARAASAGVFITMAAHVAVMAPATHIGAAHPVSLGGTSPMQPGQDTTGRGADRSPGVMEEKVVKDAVAWVKSLAELRGRNVDWAARAVTESESITETEALDQRVIDLTAPNMTDLLRRVDGRVVATQRDSLQLQTANASIREINMWWGEDLLGVLSNPNVAFILMMVGFYGILFELYTAGWGVGGTVGIISLILAFYGLSVLPVNYAGLALIGLGLGLFVAEVFVPSLGLLTLGGMVCLILGGLMLVDTSVEFMTISAWVVVPVALATGGIAVFLLGKVVSSARTRAQTGAESMVGSIAVADEPFAESGDGMYEGMVHTHGELWRAVSTKPVDTGETVEITGRKGLRLFVRAAATAKQTEGS